MQSGLKLSSLPVNFLPGWRPLKCHEYIPFIPPFEIRRDPCSGIARQQRDFVGIDGNQVARIVNAYSFPIVPAIAPLPSPPFLLVRRELFLETVHVSLERCNIVSGELRRNFVSDGSKIPFFNIFVIYIYIYMREYECCCLLLLLLHVVITQLDYFDFYKRESLTPRQREDC